MYRVCIFSCVHNALDNRIFYREARSLNQAGYDVTLIAVHERAEVKDSVKIIGLPRVPRWKRPGVWFSLLHLTLNSHADVFHFHDPELLLVAPWIRLLSGKPTIYDIHESYPDFIEVKDYMPAWMRYPIAWIFRLVEPSLAWLQSALIFSDDEIAKTFARIRKYKITLYNFPSVEFVENAIAETKMIDSRPPVVLHLGGHERNRGTRLMVEAFHRVLQEIPEAKLILAGHFIPPNLQDEVEDDINRRGMAQAVTITGRIPFELIGNYLRSSAVGWIPWQPYPKNQKNIPTKLFEYMAYGLPIVSSNLQSTRPFIQHGENGYLVEADHPSAHAHAIIKLLKNPQEAQKMGKIGQTIVQNRYTWSTEEQKLLALYRDILEK